MKFDTSFLLYLSSIVALKLLLLHISGAFGDLANKEWRTGDAIIVQAIQNPDSIHETYGSIEVPQIDPHMKRMEEGDEMPQFDNVPEGDTTPFPLVTKPELDSDFEATTAEPFLGLDQNIFPTEELPLEGPKKVIVYPWLAAVMKGRKLICTGTLIDKRHILTTAFCLFNLTSADLSDIEVDIGFKTLPDFKLERQLEPSDCPLVTEKVSKAIRHLRFSPSTAYHDVGILQLVSPLTFDEYLQPISLNNYTHLDVNAEEQHIIGWRSGIDLDGNETAYWRREEIPISSLEKCRKDYSDLLAPQGITESMLCAGGFTHGTSCRWKFGSPLVIESKESTTNPQQSISKVIAKQVGIFSWGIEALKPTCTFTPENPKPLVFTKVSAYYKWINSNLVH